MEQKSWKERLNNQEFMSGLIILIMFALIKLLSMRLPAKVSAYPIFMSNVAFVIAILFFVRCCVRMARGTISQKKMFVGDMEGRMKYWLTLVFLVLYAVLFKRLGFVISSFLFMMVFTTLFGPKEKQWGVNLAVSAGFTAVIFIAFKIILGIPLPTLFIGR